MPASYAHHRFGKALLAALPAEERRCVQRFRSLYNVGLQGPDLFFYHNPLMHTATGALGHQYHAMSGKDFFPAACAAAASEAGRAYLYGLLAHYCLDSVCHPYVQQIVSIGEARHIALEAELERHLLLLDKEPSPQTFDMSRYFRLTRGECMTVAAFYPPATGFGVKQSITNYALAEKLLSHPRRSRVEKLLKLVNPKFRDFLIPEAEDETLTLYVRELKVLYDQALERYPRLLTQLLEYQKTGKPLGPEFDPTFS